VDVGVNYPWVDYGWDFGEAPPSWRGAGAEPGWRGRIDAHLSRFAELGLKVVRWFILGDGLAYGTGPDAPQRIGPGDQGWSFTPPPLAPALQAHFGQLLERFEAVNHGHASPRITLLPVLVDFLFFQPGAWPVVRVTAAGEPPRPDPGWVKGGRADVVNDPAKRRAFLAEALAPLLRISRAHARLIHGWEIVNEPEWVTRGWHPHARRRLPVEASAMRALVEEASAAIRREGFRPTVGFARRETLERTGLLTELNQFHHYADGRRRLVPPDPPAILGELATSAEDVWPELRRSGQRVLHRLRLAERQGYPLALLWCAAPLVSGTGGDRHGRWDAAVEEDVACFTQGRAPDRIA
jgi:hypothetical protein